LHRRDVTGGEQSFKGAERAIERGFTSMRGKPFRRFKRSSLLLRCPIIACEAGRVKVSARESGDEATKPWSCRCRGDWVVKARI
jgi:hypothetical protein